MTESVIYNKSQGSGWVTDEPEIFLAKIEPKTVTLAGIEIKPGDMTDLNGHFCRELEYVGVINDKPLIELLFVIGKTQSLFPTYYFQSVYYVSEVRILEVYSHNGMRDFNFIDNIWK